MLLKYSAKTAYRGLRTNKSRSFLTILGIVIGITAIILIMSIGQGAQDLILNQIQGMGSKTIAVAPGREPQGPSDIAQVFSDSLKENDLAALQKKVNAPHIKEISPIIFGGETAAYGSETYRMTIFGSSELIFKIFSIYPEKGIMFSDEDIKNRNDVAIIGAKVKEELFGESEAISQKIKIKGRNFKIIGVLPKKGQVSFFNFDEIVIVPYTTAQQYIFGIKYFHRFLIEADSEEYINQTVRDIEITLRNTHKITGGPEKNDFFVETQADVAQRLSTVTSVFTLFLVSVAAISLIVGGIGIMNIMLVSVSERTREIGLRKAIGATEKNILTQFLLEAIMLTGFGGFIGVILGAVLSFISSIILTRIINIEWVFSFPLFAAFIGISVAILVGVIFGLYPARKASSKDPIEALRYE
ncbi:MAG: ABC transporter permease [Patescibacteria group bacterium]